MGRLEELPVQQVALRQLAKSWIARNLAGKKQILRHHVCLIVRRIFLADAVAALPGKQRLRSGQNPIENLPRLN